MSAAVSRVRILHPIRVGGGSLRLDLMLGSQQPTKDMVAREFQEVWAGTLTLQGSEAHDRLEDLWRIVEIGGPTCPIPRLARLPNAIRSFVVGDVVDIDGALWFVADWGWRQIEGPPPPGEEHQAADHANNPHSAHPDHETP